MALHTPALDRRVVVAGLSMVAVLALALDLLLYVSVRASHRERLEDDLDRHAAIVAEEARRRAAGDLTARLAARGVTATVRESGASPASPAPRGGAGPLVTRSVELPGGQTAEVAVPRSRMDRELRRLLLTEAMATPLVLALAFLLLRLVAEIALRPLDTITAAARRTAGGHRGERLNPVPAHTRLGQMASAYDRMLDALEAAVTKAETAQAQTTLLLERNRRIIDTAREAFVVVDDDCRIIEWNTEAERIFGWPRHEALGRPLAGTVIPAEEPELCALDHFRSQSAASSDDRIVSITALHRDGRRFPARMTAWATPHHGSSTVSALIWDVTEQLRAEEAVARLATIVESSDEAMLSTDLEGRILTWNLGAERMYGYTAAEAVGRHLDLIVPEEGREQVALSLAAAAQGEPVQRIEVLRRRRDGTLINVALTISPVREPSGAVCAASSIARDVTAERRVAARLKDTLAALEAAVHEARSSEDATRRFLDDAAHQLRGPITNIRACAEALLRGSGPDGREELLGDLARETVRAGRLMSGLLRMARLNQGHEIAPVPCDLLALCRDEAERLAPVAPHLQVSVTAAGSRPVGRPLLDPHALAEIVSNLLDNARRHAASRIDLVLTRDAGRVDLEVRDDGPGMPEDAVESAFDRFVSLDGRGGSGLGLPIARQLARAHGGDVVYEGRAFVVRLPVADQDWGPDLRGAGGSLTSPAGRAVHGR